MDEPARAVGLGGILRCAGMQGLHPEEGVNAHPGLVNVSLQRWLEDGTLAPPGSPGEM